MNTKENNHIVYGENACFGVLNGIYSNNKRELFSLFLTKESEILYLSHNNKIYRKLINYFKQKITITDKNHLKKLSSGEDSHQGIVLKVSDIKNNIYNIDDFIIDQNSSGKLSKIFILDQLQDPHNIGAIIRSAYCFGFDGVAISEKNSPPINTTIIRTSAGYSEEMNIWRPKNITNTIQILQENGYTVVCLDSNKNDDKNIDYAKLKKLFSEQNIAIIVGSEKIGIRDIIRNSCDYSFTIPMAKGADSLNVSNAVAVVGFIAI